MTDAHSQGTPRRISSLSPPEGCCADAVSAAWQDGAA